MEDKTKEILNKLLEYFKESNINDFGYEKDKLISYEEAQILLDYITNLQEENERLKAQLNGCDELLDNDEVMIDKYKSRNEKAIEFIEHENFKRTLLGFSENKYLKNIQKELLNILGGKNE